MGSNHHTHDEGHSRDEGARHGHGHGHAFDDLTPEEFKARFERPEWEARYSGERVWSGNPNPQLVAEAAALTPGSALDIGCGEGGDAVWLAQQGWHVTAADFAQAALDRTREHAEERAVADRVSYERLDIRTWRPDGRTWDLVTSQYMHLLDNGMIDVAAHLATAVAPGGTLLIVGHHPLDMDTGLRWKAGDTLFTADDIAPALEPKQWRDIRAEMRTRDAPNHEGGMITVHDAVLVATRI